MKGLMIFVLGAGVAVAVEAQRYPGDGRILNTTPTGLPHQRGSPGHEATPLGLKTFVRPYPG